MVKNDLNRPITAHFIRFLPVEWNYKPCMRVELYGTAIGKNKTHFTTSFRQHVCLGVCWVLETFLYFTLPRYSYFLPLMMTQRWPSKRISLSCLFWCDITKESTYTLYFVFCSLSVESQEWQMLRISFHVQRKETLQMHHRLGVDALVRYNVKLWQGRQVGKLPSKYVLCSFSYNFQLQLPRCSHCGFTDCFTSESLSRENIILVSMNDII